MECERSQLRKVTTSLLKETTFVKFSLRMCVGVSNCTTSFNIRVVRIN